VAVSSQDVSIPSSSIASLLPSRNAGSWALALENTRVKHRGLSLFLSALLLSACASSHSLPGTPGANSAPSGLVGDGTVLDLPPRLQWNANFGYCGETSMISAGLYYGQYVSQYTARSVASDGTPQNENKSQLLLGVNDAHAAIRMHLKFRTWDTKAERNTGEFLRWVRGNVERAYPVIIGVYTNERRFYGKGGGDPLFDHIVPVNAVDSSTLTFSDNGLWNPTGKPRFNFTYPFATFAKTRRQANDPQGPIYSIASGGTNYGIAIRGVADADGETLPVQVTTNVNWERPVMQNHSNVRPRPMPLTLTIVVSGLQPGVAYKLYRYDQLGRIPDGHFNAKAANAQESWSIKLSSGGSYTMTESIMSDDVAAYRAVPASAP
jgi:hypothetical protein